MQKLARSSRLMSVSAGPGHDHLDPAPPEFVSKQQAHLQGHVLLMDPAREVEPGIAGIDAAVTGIDGHDMPRQEPIGETLEPDGEAPGRAGMAGPVSSSRPRIASQA